MPNITAHDLIEEFATRLLTMEREIARWKIQYQSKTDEAENYNRYWDECHSVMREALTVNSLEPITRYMARWK